LTGLLELTGGIGQGDKERGDKGREEKERDEKKISVELDFGIWILVFGFWYLDFVISILAFGFFQFFTSFKRLFLSFDH